ncbi:MAG: squalene/phytoene synthase family protein [Pseudomonadota bacterium]|nr:squalene/phytoene synthase family protein [Pseudomonadota bacterium]
MSGSLTELGRQVRERDWERFICALFAPNERRQALFAILAFNAELARTRSVVSEPLLGEVRLQWWRDALATIYDDTGVVPVGSPLLADLASAIRRYHLPRQVLDAMIDARSADLEMAPHADLDALLAYASATSGGVTELTLYALGAYAGEGEGDVEPYATIRRAGARVGTAWSLIGLIRASEFMAAEGHTFLPRQLLDQVGLNPEKVIAGEFSPPLAELLQLIAGVASQYILECQAVRDQMPKICVPAFLPAGMAGRYLQRLRRAQFNPTGGVLEGGRRTAQLGVLWRALTGRY